MKAADPVSVRSAPALTTAALPEAGATGSRGAPHGRPVPEANVGVVVAERPTRHVGDGHWTRGTASSVSVTFPHFVS